MHAERLRSERPTNGRFAWNAFAFDHHVAAAIDGQHADTPMPHTGLRLEAPYGGFAGEPLDDDSGEHVFVARR